MIKNKWAVFLTIFFIAISILGFTANNNFARATVLNAPVIIQVSEDVKNTFKPVINGSTGDNTLVKIYIDGIYNGKTDFLAGDSNRISFAYQSFVDLKSGPHSIWAIAEDREGGKSQPSNIFNFEVKAGVPTPTLFMPVVNGDTNYERPFIVGLSKNNLVVKVFIDDTSSGEVKISGNTDTVSFYYKPAQPLSIGSHTVYSIAIDNDGRESKKSNIVNFKVYNPEIVSNEEKNNKEAQTTSQNEQNQETSATSPISEGKQKPLKNLIIFIVFVIIIIGWVGWANRKLIKEKIKNIKGKK
jgi:hypothetical protein